MNLSFLGDSLAFVNAMLNATSGVLLVVARRAIKRGERDLHKRLMLSAVAVSGAFLVSYLTRVALTGTHADPHTGALHAFYLAVLATHMLLAMAVVPLALGSLWLGLRGRFAAHKKLVKWTYPVWLYVSVTGVVVYVVLYHVPA
jgi:putative membrane protein